MISPRTGKTLPWRFMQQMQKHLLRASLLASLAACTGPSTQPPAFHIAAPRRAPPTGADAPLFGFFQALDRLSGPGAGSGAPPVVVLQIGDSHTANDSFASALRDRLQARFGNAGRGLLQPGIPFKWYRPESVSVAESPGGFTAISSFSTSTVGPFGIAAVRQHAAGPADATLTQTDGSSIGNAEIEFLAQPGGGSVEVAAPPAPPRLVVTNGTPGPVWVQLAPPPGTSTITVHAVGDGPVDWLSWSVLRGTPGVTFSNLGIPGASVGLLDRWDPGIAQAELAHVQPALVIVAFGTNEGFKPSLDSAAYEQDFEQHLAFLHAAAPAASLIVFGAPDGQRKRQRSVPEGTVCDARYAIPPHLPEVRALAREAAARQNAYYWDWSAAMGGECSMARWADANPPMGMPDHVHMRTPGYAITANVLFDTLMQAYDRYRATAGGA